MIHPKIFHDRLGNPPWMKISVFHIASMEIFQSVNVRFQGCTVFYLFQKVGKQYQSHKSPVVRQFQVTNPSSPLSPSSRTPESLHRTSEMMRERQTGSKGWYRSVWCLGRGVFFFLEKNDDCLDSPYFHQFAMSFCLRYPQRIGSWKITSVSWRWHEKETDLEAIQFLVHQLKPFVLFWNGHFGIEHLYQRFVQRGL